MKNIFNYAIAFGILVIISGAGGYETMSASFTVSLVIMLFGAALVGLGVCGNEQYKKYCRRYAVLCSRKKKAVHNINNGADGNFVKIRRNQKMTTV